MACRMTGEQRLLIEKAVRRSGKKMNEWMRDALMQAAGPVERAAPHQGAKFMPLDQRRPAVVEPVQLNGHSAPVIKMPVPSRPEGKKPGWWDQLVQDAMKCPGHRMPV